MKMEYEALLDRRLRHEKLEAENIAEFIGAGGYNNVDYGGTISIMKDRSITPEKESFTSALRPARFKVWFSPIKKQLSIILPSDGVLTIVDLKGRQIDKIIVKKNMVNEGTAKLQIHASFPVGVVIVRFATAPEQWKRQSRYSDCLASFIPFYALGFFVAKKL